MQKMDRARCCAKQQEQNAFCSISLQSARQLPQHRPDRWLRRTKSSSQFLSSIDAEIERLQSLREQVAAAVDADQAITKTAKTVRRGMSEEGRQKIAAAQKARWAKQKKATKATKGPARKTTLKQMAKNTTTKGAVKKRPGKKAAAVKQRNRPSQNRASDAPAAARKG